MITVGNPSKSIGIPLINGYDFRSLSIPRQPRPIAISPSEIRSIGINNPLHSFEIEFPDFDSRFSFHIIEVEGELSSNEIILHSRFNDNFVKMTLSGEWPEDDGLYLNNISLAIEREGETPLAVFLLKSLWAMFGLGSKAIIHIPVLLDKLPTSFEASISVISDLLETRQIAYRLMVIEKAFDVKLPFPSFVEGEVIEDIAYCYRSVVDRNFEWPCPVIEMPWAASSSYLALLPEQNVPFPIQFGPEPFSKEIFGFPLNLNLQTARIEECILDNFDEVKEKLSKLDGKEVFIKAHSKSGVMLIESITTPTLPKNAFSKAIQQLIDLEEKFDSMILEKYFTLASSTLDGLTERQKEGLTARPELAAESLDF